MSEVAGDGRPALPPATRGQLLLGTSAMVKLGHFVLFFDTVTM